MIQFHIPLEKNPVPYQNNVRHTRNGHFKTPKLKSYQEFLRWHATQQVDEPLEVSYDKTFTLYLRFHLKNKTHGDLDNMAKSVIDAFEGVLFTNDKFCSKLSLAYEYRDEPGIAVTFF